MVYEARTYRKLHQQKDLCHFQVMVGETDLDIAVRKERYDQKLVELAAALVREERDLLKEYINRDPVFLTTLEPYEPLPDAPFSVLEMSRAAQLAGVGPMAAVAGYFAETVGKKLSAFSREVIIENGGDIWLKTSKTRHVGIFAGKSPFTHRIALEIKAGRTPLGICTSSGTVGHSLSFGKADAMVILAPSAILADAVATAACNMVQNAADLESAVNFALNISGVTGAVAILGDKMAARGEIKLVPM
ncbi:MAG: ApbE family lipoprotein [Peptococcaceae bacterium]|nr:ApbE family lipoprotein [Peptococcaceae bacterium]